jgi:hypothetical protein
VSFLPQGGGEKIRKENNECQEERAKERMKRGTEGIKEGRNQRGQKQERNK